jgi:hypothetical protein
MRITPFTLWVTSANPFGGLEVPATYLRACRVCSQGQEPHPSMTKGAGAKARGGKGLMEPPPPPGGGGAIELWVSDLRQEPDPHVPRYPTSSLRSLAPLLIFSGSEAAGARRARVAGRRKCGVISGDHVGGKEGGQP